MAIITNARDVPICADSVAFCSLCVPGLFEPGYMQYETFRETDTAGEPSIADMVEKAINILKRSDDGYFLFVEG